MILEVATLKVRPGDSAGFEAAFRTAQAIIAATPGYVSHELQHCIEREHPQDLAALYGLTHAATDEINALQDEFLDNGSEVETGAREALGAEFAFIATAYGFENADGEELIGTRDW